MVSTAVLLLCAETASAFVSSVTEVEGRECDNDARLCVVGALKLRGSVRLLGCERKGVWPLWRASSFASWSVWKWRSRAPRGDLLRRELASVYIIDCQDIATVEKGIYVDQTYRIGTCKAAW